MKYINLLRKGLVLSTLAVTALFAFALTTNTTVADLTSNGIELSSDFTAPFVVSGNNIGLIDNNYLIAAGDVTDSKKFVTVDDDSGTAFSNVQSFAFGSKNSAVIDKDGNLWVSGSIVIDESKEILKSYVQVDLEVEGTGKTTSIFPATDANVTVIDGETKEEYSYVDGTFGISTLDFGKYTIEYQEDGGVVLTKTALECFVEEASVQTLDVEVDGDGDGETPDPEPEVTPPANVDVLLTITGVEGIEKTISVSPTATITIDNVEYSYNDTEETFGISTLPLGQYTISTYENGDIVLTKAELDCDIVETENDYYKKDTDPLYGKVTRIESYQFTKTVSVTDAKAMKIDGNYVVILCEDGLYSFEFNADHYAFDYEDEVTNSLVKHTSGTYESTQIVDFAVINTNTLIVLFDDGKLYEAKVTNAAELELKEVATNVTLFDADVSSESYVYIVENTKLTVKSTSTYSLMSNKTTTLNNVVQVRVYKDSYSYLDVNGNLFNSDNNLVASNVDFFDVGTSGQIAYVSAKSLTLVETEGTMFSELASNSKDMIGDLELSVGDISTLQSYTPTFYEYYNNVATPISNTTNMAVRSPYKVTMNFKYVDISDDQYISLEITNDDDKVVTTWSSKGLNYNVYDLETDLFPSKQGEYTVSVKLHNKNNDEQIGAEYTNTYLIVEKMLEDSSVQFATSTVVDGETQYTVNGQYADYYSGAGSEYSIVISANDDNKEIFESDEYEISVRIYSYSVDFSASFYFEGTYNEDLGCVISDEDLWYYMPKMVGKYDVEVYVQYKKTTPVVSKSTLIVHAGDENSLNESNGSVVKFEVDEEQVKEKLEWFGTKEGADILGDIVEFLSFSKSENVYSIDRVNYKVEKIVSGSQSLHRVYVDDFSVESGDVIINVYKASDVDKLNPLTKLTEAGSYVVEIVYAGYQRNANWVYYQGVTYSTTFNFDVEYRLALSDSNIGKNAQLYITRDSGNVTSNLEGVMNKTTTIDYSYDGADYYPVILANYSNFSYSPLTREETHTTYIKFTSENGVVYEFEYAHPGLDTAAYYSLFDYIPKTPGTYSVLIYMVDSRVHGYTSYSEEQQITINESTISLNDTVNANDLEIVIDNTNAFDEVYAYYVNNLLENLTINGNNRSSIFVVEKDNTFTEHELSDSLFNIVFTNSDGEVVTKLDSKGTYTITITLKDEYNTGYVQNSAVFTSTFELDEIFYIADLTPLWIGLGVIASIGLFVGLALLFEKFRKGRYYI